MRPRAWYPAGKQGCSSRTMRAWRAGERRAAQPGGGMCGQRVPGAARIPCPEYIYST
ncbi:MAG: hypothetical protein OJF49_001415 [Ktedonobacterales bacterium]|nr:MAG: hypothetical protein OJF49_001415 [Ktedonobacterales bacterium]